MSNQVCPGCGCNLGVAFAYEKFEIQYKNRPMKEVLSCCKRAFSRSLLVIVFGLLLFFSLNIIMSYLMHRYDPSRFSADVNFIFGPQGYLILYTLIFIVLSIWNLRDYKKAAWEKFWQECNK